MEPKKVKHTQSKHEANTEQSPKNLKTEKSQSTAHGTLRKNEQSHIIDGAVTGGPSMEDSKFLMESSMAQNSISIPHQSKFTDNDEHEHISKGMHNIPENNSLYHES